MNKTELINAVAENLSLPRRTVSAVLDSLIAEITACTRNHEEVSISGLFNTHIEHKPARIGRNPSTGNSMELPAKTVIKIKPAKSLCDAANKDQSA